MALLDAFLSFFSFTKVIPPSWVEGDIIASPVFASETFRSDYVSTQKIRFKTAAGFLNKKISMHHGSPENRCKLSCLQICYALFKGMQYVKTI